MATGAGSPQSSVGTPRTLGSSPRLTSTRDDARRLAMKGREEMQKEGIMILKERKRRIREALMKDMAKFEESIIEPYLEVYNAAPADWLVRTNERCQVVLQTNQQLQEQVSEMEMKVRLTENANAAKSAELDAITAEVDTSRSKQIQLEAQLQEVRQTGLLEEECLREQNVALHTKLSKLKRMNKRLEDQRRVDENLIARNSKVLLELQQMQCQLESLKAEYEMGEFSEHPATQKSRFSYQVGAGTPSGEDRSQTDSPEPARTLSERPSLAEIPTQAQLTPYSSESQDTSGAGSPLRRTSVKKRHSLGVSSRPSRSGSMLGTLATRDIPGTREIPG